MSGWWVMNDVSLRLCKPGRFCRRDAIGLVGMVVGSNLKCGNRAETNRSISSNRNTRLPEGEGVGEKWQWDCVARNE